MVHGPWIAIIMQKLIYDISGSSMQSCPGAEFFAEEPEPKPNFWYRERSRIFKRERSRPYFFLFAFSRKFDKKYFLDKNDVIDLITL